MFLLLSSLVLVFTSVTAFRSLPPIVGGQDARIEDYPYQISLEVFGTHHCGGSIISEKYIITAAHCISKDTRYRVRVGATISSHGGETVNIAKITTHPEFDYVTASNDIAVIELKTPLVFSKTVNKINLPDAKELSDDTIVNVTGYGLTKFRSQRLQAVQVPIISREVCCKAYEGYIREIEDNMICAGYLDEGGMDACQGDSGGPLAYDGKLYGVVSWGIGCAKPGLPGVYSNVALLLSFIKDVTGLEY